MTSTGLLTFANASVAVLTEDASTGRIFGLDAQLLFDVLIQGFAVFLLFIFLSYVLINPVRKMLEDRQKKIQDDITNARNDREEAAKLTDDLMILPQMVQRAIDLNPQIAQLAERYKNNPSLFFIGRNVDYAVCMEGSLKLKEISYLHSEAYAAGELKHGTIALIEENRLVIAVACYEPLFDKTMSNVKEVKARGARVLGVALEGNRAIYSEADDVILVPRMDDLFVVPAEIVPLQLFAYYVAKANGCAIDKPKNLAKSVTVE